MKIAMIDLVHTTCGTHSNVVPLGVGLISTYVKKNIDQPLDIKIFKEANKAIEAFKTWVPDMVGISQYTWNAELNLYFGKFLKSLNPNCLVVAGGPNLDLEKDKRYSFLKKNNFVDLCVAYDGEIPFLEITRRLLKGEKVDDLKKSPSAGVFSISPENQEYVEGLGPPPRLKSLDDFGPVYANGVFDEFLDAGYQPFTQTHRGCPYTCAYCRTSDSYNSKMLFLSPEIFRQDLEFLSKKFSGRTDRMLYIANTNMGFFDEDFEIARIIKEMQDKYNWPKYVFFDSGKDPEKLLKLLSIIKFVPAPALQTLTPQVLENIKRRNLPLPDYIKFQKEVLRRTGENSMSELILCLPGETRETFLDTLRKVINSGVQSVVIYTLINLTGTPLSTKEFSDKYKYTLKYRIVPRQFSEIDGTKILDTEEVIVGTKDMSYADYMYLRGLCFTLNTIFSVPEFIPIKRFLLEYEVEIAQWVFNMHDQIKRYPEVAALFQDFVKETEDELFDTREELISFFEKPENFSDLLSGAKGDNLMRKFRYLAVAEHFLQFLHLAVTEAGKLISLKYPENNHLIKMLADLEKYLALRNIGPIIKNGIKESEENIAFDYDIPRWIENPEKTDVLGNFNRRSDYNIIFSKEQKELLGAIFSTHHGTDLSLHMLYRDGRTKDLWPKLVRKS